MMLVIVPFWTSFLIRIYAWINILQHDGLLNKMLLGLHLISAPLVWLSTDSAMYLGIVYSYLPFMILPLYVDPRQDRAGAAGSGRRSWLVAARRVLAGDVSLVVAGRRRRLPALLHSDRRRIRDPGSFGGINSMMIGQTLWLEFFTNRDWPVASAAAVVLLALLLLPLAPTTGCTPPARKRAMMCDD